MQMKKSMRLASLVAVAMVVAYVGLRTKEDVVVLPAKNTPNEAVKDEPPAPVVGTKRSKLSSGVLQNPFGVLNLNAVVQEPNVTPVLKPATQPGHHKWAVKKKPVPPPVTIAIAPEPEIVPPEPAAPPLPFRNLGSIQGPRIADGKQVVFIDYRGSALAMRIGDVVANSYRVESITATQINFMYLPLKKVQTLSLQN
jgi:hypothetical protein